MSAKILVWRKQNIYPSFLIFQNKSEKKYVFHGNMHSERLLQSLSVYVILVFTETIKAE